MIFDHSVDIIIIQEVKMNKHNVDKVVGHIWYDVKYDYSEVVGASTEIANT